MTTPLTRPAAVGLMPAGHDPRPCVNKPPQWWDLGNEHNARAVRYCKNVCPLQAECAAGIGNDVNRPKSQIRAGRAFNEYGKRVKICADCDHPRGKNSFSGPVVCGCTPKTTTDKPAQVDQFEEARTDRRVERRADLITRYLPLRGAGLTIADSAVVLNVPYQTLRNAVVRARAAGDTRIPARPPIGGFKKEKVA